MAAIAAFPGRKERQPQSPFEECFATLGEVHDESVYGAIERLVQAGEQVSFSIHDLIRMLKGGWVVGARESCKEDCQAALDGLGTV